MPSSQAPVVIYLPQYRSVLAFQQGDGQIKLQGEGNKAHISGIFAQSLSNLMAGSATPKDLQRLQILEKQHAWLKGISRGYTDEEQLHTLLLGESLGMLFIEVTDQCNERCIHCYASSSPDCNSFLTLSEIKHVLDDAREMSKPFVQFTGGDPLIHKALVPAVAYASQLNFQGIEIYTNGLLLSDALLTQLKPYQPRISFSIYADNAEIHDAITQLPGSWKKTLAAMQRAKQAGFDIRAGVALMPENISCVDRIIPFLQHEIALPAEHVRFDPVKQTGRGQFMTEASQILIEPSHAPNADHLRRGKLCVSANGNIYPCIFSRKNLLGNIRTKSLKENIQALKHRSGAQPSAKHWKYCRTSLSCGDCQIIAYALGEE